MSSPTQIKQWTDYLVKERAAGQEKFIWDWAINLLESNKSDSGYQSLIIAGLHAGLHQQATSLKSWQEDADEMVISLRERLGDFFIAQLRFNKEVFLREAKNEGFEFPTNKAEVTEYVNKHIYSKGPLTDRELYLLTRGNVESGDDIYRTGFGNVAIHLMIASGRDGEPIQEKVFGVNKFLPKHLYIGRNDGGKYFPIGDYVSPWEPWSNLNRLPTNKDRKMRPAGLSGRTNRMSADMERSDNDDENGVEPGGRTASMRDSRSFTSQRPSSQLLSAMRGRPPMQGQGRGSANMYTIVPFS